MKKKRAKKTSAEEGRDTERCPTSYLPRALYPTGVGRILRFPPRCSSRTWKEAQPRNALSDRAAAAAARVIRDFAVGHR